MYHIIKRILDFILALILLIIFIIPMMIAAICIKIEDKGPVLFKQKRIGKDEKPFYIYKFRTMAEKRRDNMTHEEMVTKVGKILRKTSIDELPQLLNILKGEMSFIGPRPWIPEYYEWFTDEQKRRMDVLPGISGLAQVKGRNGISIFKKIEYDIEYEENISFLLDLKIMCWTLLTVLSKSNTDISEKQIKEEIRQLKENKIGI